MATWREQKREARGIVHDTMAIDAAYYAETGSDPVPVRARLHWTFAPIGDDRSMGWAERQAINTRMVFMRSELASAGIVLAKAAVVYLQPGEAYQIDNTLPPDDITVTAEVTRLSVRQYAQEGLPAGSEP